MKKSICHYSFHRTWKEKKWDCGQLAKAVKGLGIEAVDFHAGLMGSTEGAVKKIRSALDETGLALSGLSLGNDFNKSDKDELKKQVDAVISWIRIAAQVKAPVSRIFGGSLSREQRHDEKIRAERLSLILEALASVVREAEKEGVVLALENHGGLPCTGEEQAAVIRQINSKNLRATVDVGNYMQGGQEGHIGSEIAAPYAAYVHFKDMKKIPDKESPFGYKLQSCIVGSGAVDHAKCLKALSKAGYNGYVALEFEGVEGEDAGVPQSVSFMNRVMEPYSLG